MQQISTSGTSFVHSTYIKKLNSMVYGVQDKNGHVTEEDYVNVCNKYGLYEEDGLRILNLGITKIRTQYTTNFKILIEYIQLTIGECGHFFFDTSGVFELDDIEKFEATIRMYKLAYKEILNLDKRLDIEQDFGYGEKNETN